MCGRFAMDAKTDELIQEYVATGGRPEDWWASWHGSYSIAPTDSAPIVRERSRDRGEGRILELVRWDWENPPRVPQNRPIFNAKIEKLTGGWWGRAFAAARCVVPMRGYYEWTGPAGDKTPHFLHGHSSTRERELDPLMSAAGLTWSMDVGGEPTRCFVVITREARDASGEIHDRMPAFLTPGARDLWLEPVKLDAAGKQEMLDVLHHSSAEVAGTIRSRIVDRKVKNSRTVDPLDPTLIDAA